MPRPQFRPGCMEVAGNDDPLRVATQELKCLLQVFIGRSRLVFQSDHVRRYSALDQPFRHGLGFTVVPGDDHMQRIQRIRQRGFQSTCESATGPTVDKAGTENQDRAH